MKRAATAAFAASSLFAGVRIQMEHTDLATNKTTTQTMLLDSTRLRVDSDDKTTMMFLTDGGRNRMVLLDRAKNEYREIDEQTMKQLGAQINAAMAQMQEQMKNLPPEQRKMVEQMMKGKMPQAAANAAPKTVYTAKGGGSVSGFSCTKYEGMEGNQKVADVCAASASQIRLAPGDFQVFQKMKDFVASLTSAMSSLPFYSNLAAGRYFENGIEGFPIQRISYENGKADDRSELKSVTPASFSDADFSLGNAKKIEVDLPAGPRGRGKQR
jgi:Domain of unknown function (DUF4412)